MAHRQARATLTLQAVGWGVYAGPARQSGSVVVNRGSQIIKRHNHVSCVTIYLFSESLEIVKTVSFYTVRPFHNSLPFVSVRLYCRTVGNYEYICSSQ